MSTVPDTTHHCARCGKLKLTRAGRPHRCGPTDKQRIRELEAEVAQLRGDFKCFRCGDGHTLLYCLNCAGALAAGHEPPEKKQRRYLVLDEAGCGACISGIHDHPRGGWLAGGSWLTLFPSQRQARAAIARTRQFAKAHALPWLKDVSRYRVIAVRLSAGNTEREATPRKGSA